MYQEIVRRDSRVVRNRVMHCDVPTAAALALANGGLPAVGTPHLSLMCRP